MIGVAPQHSILRANVIGAAFGLFGALPLALKAWSLIDLPYWAAFALVPASFVVTAAVNYPAYRARKGI